MSLRGYAELIEPPDLRNRVKIESAAALAAYDLGTLVGSADGQDQEV